MFGDREDAADLLMPPTDKHADEEKVLFPKAALMTPGPADVGLTERIERALQATGYGPLRAVEVSVNARFVCLAGRVPSYYLKQIAQATALAIAGTYQIHNRLDVVSSN
jgi:hypothetical protein